MVLPSATASSLRGNDSRLDDPSAMEELLSRPLPLDDSGASSSPEEIDSAVANFAAAAGALLADLEEPLILMAVMVVLKRRRMETEGWFVLEKAMKNDTSRH